MAVLLFLGADADELAAAGMGFMFSNVTGFSLIVGFGAGATPLISQAFGARNFQRCGDLVQRQLAIHAMLLPLVGGIWYCTESILLAFGQPPVVSKLSADFMRWRILALPFFALKEDLICYLTAQRVMRFPMVVSSFANLTNIALYPVLIARFGFIGAPLGMNIGNVLQAVFTLAFTKWSLPVKEAWPAWNLKAALSGWCEMLKMAGPGGVMMLSEWWGWEINLFLAGILCQGVAGPCVELDVFPMLSNTMVMSFFVHFGFSCAASALVGNALGAGLHERAKRISHTMLILAAAISGCVSLYLLSQRDRWGAYFTDDVRVIALTAQVMPYVAGYIFLDALGPGALTSLLRSMGLVRVPATINFVSFYAVGIPLGVFLTFTDAGGRRGLSGLWAGLLLGMFTMVACLLIYLLGVVDFGQAAADAQSAAAVAAPEDEVEGGQARELKVHATVVGNSVGYSKISSAEVNTDGSPTSNANEVL